MQTRHRVFRNDDLKQLKADFDAAPRKAIVFHHIHKTGGRSLATAIEKSLPPERVFAVSTPDECDAFERAIRNGVLNEDGTYFIYGHRTILLAELLSDTIPVFGITVLRDPVEMFGSQFSYQHTRHGRTDLRSEDFRAHYGSDRLIDFLGFESSADAMARCEETFSFIGIQQNLSASLSMLVWLLSLPVTSFENRNVVSAEDYVELNLDLVAEFVRANVEDYVFYEFMKTRHSQLFRQFQTMDGTKKVEFKVAKASVHKPAKLNFDLAKNNNKFSLILTGTEILKTDRETAMAFFDKAFDMQWSLAPRIYAILVDDDPKRAKNWMREKILFLRTLEGGEARKIAKSLDAHIQPAWRRLFSAGLRKLKSRVSGRE